MPARAGELPLDRALKAIHMRRADLAVDADHLPGPEAPALLRRALRDPLCAPSAADSVAGQVEGNVSAAFALRTVAGLIDIEVREKRPSISVSSPVEAAGRLYASCGSRLSPEEARSWRAAF